jgi:methylenetetrahydrofolate reductase (NADPH)
MDYTMDASTFFDDLSIEITSRDLDSLGQVASSLPPKTKIAITFLPNDTMSALTDAAMRVADLGFTPVSHIAARRIPSEADLEAILRTLVERAGVNHVFVIAGDLAAPVGPYSDTVALISDRHLIEHGIRHVGIAGYPEGHGSISPDALWESLLAKASILTSHEQTFDLVTQFGFDADSIAAWTVAVRDAGISCPIRIGIPGPTSVKSLLRFAARCGVGASAKVMKKYGVSITKILTTATPDVLVEQLIGLIASDDQSRIHAHLYPFGGLDKTVEWIKAVHPAMQLVR